MFAAAHAIADTPVFSRYRQLDGEYPGARFIYLERSLAAWLPSVQRLLASMHRHLHPVEGGLDEQVKACYRDVFGALSPQQIRDRDYLSECYVRHRAGVLDHFATRGPDLLCLDVSRPDAGRELCDFLGVGGDGVRLARVNRGAEHTFWDRVVHENKIPSRLPLARPGD